MHTYLGTLDTRLAPKPQRIYDSLTAKTVVTRNESACGQREPMLGFPGKELEFKGKGHNTVFAWDGMRRGSHQDSPRLSI